jgi:NTP pyrophosphatase (non-canonical NTP hydrolase)
MKNKIEKWASERNIDGFENRFQQLVKLSEEVGELSGAVLKQKQEEIIDAIGDIQVVLIILSKQLDIDYDKALESAWNVIKDRSGKTINGTFIKSE